MDLGDLESKQLHRQICLCSNVRLCGSWDSNVRATEAMEEITRATGVLILSSEARGKERLEGVPDNVKDLIAFFERDMGATVDKTCCGTELTRAQILEQILKFFMVPWKTHTLYGMFHAFPDGSWKLADGHPLTFHDIIGCWEAAKEAQLAHHLQIFVDSCYSGSWVHLAHQRGQEDIFVQAACGIYPFETSDEPMEGFAKYWIATIRDDSRPTDEQLRLMDAQGACYWPPWSSELGVGEPVFEANMSILQIRKIQCENLWTPPHTQILPDEKFDQLDGLHSAILSPSDRQRRWKDIASLEWLPCVEEERMKMPWCNEPGASRPRKSQEERPGQIPEPSYVVLMVYLHTVFQFLHTLAPYQEIEERSFSSFRNKRFKTAKDMLQQKVASGDLNLLTDDHIFQDGIPKENLPDVMEMFARKMWITMHPEFADCLFAIDPETRDIKKKLDDKRCLLHSWRNAWYFAIVRDPWAGTYWDQFVRQFEHYGREVFTRKIALMGQYIVRGGNGDIQTLQTEDIVQTSLDEDDWSSNSKFGLENWGEYLRKACGPTFLEDHEEERRRHEEKKKYPHAPKRRP